MPGRKAGSKNRNFPSQTLTEALRVPRVIQDEAGGMTTTRLTLADLLKTTPSSSVFTQLVASSRFYGLTEGGINATEFKPTILGEQAVGDGENELSAALKQAVMKVAPFKLFFDTYANKKMPAAAAMKDFLVNKASVPEEHADAAMAHLRADAATAGLTKTLNGAQWVDFEGVPQAPPSDDESDDEETSLAEDVPAAETNGGPPVDETEPPAEPPAPPAAPPEPEIPQAIFVAGRKGPSLTQLTKILDEYKIPHLLAEDQANEGLPISVKVAETMRKCGAAILVFTADEELRDLDGNPVWKSSENISHELGAAGMRYGNRIIIFREERVKLASNYKDIGHITFTEGELHAKGIELFRELIAFGLVSLTVGSSTSPGA